MTMNSWQETQGGCDNLKDSSGEVEFNDVSLRYAAEEKYVLRGINFKTERKEKVNQISLITKLIMDSHIIDTGDFRVPKEQNFMDL